MILCGYQHIASLDPNAYSNEDVETDSVSKPILGSKLIPIPEPIPDPIPIPELIPEPIPELVPEPIPKLVPESIPQTDSGPTIRNRFQKILELAGIDSDEIFFFPISNQNSFITDTLMYKMTFEGNFMFVRPLCLCSFF